MLCDELNWDQDGIDILGSVPIHTTGSFLKFPLHRANWRFLKQTTSTAVYACFLDDMLQNRLPNLLTVWHLSSGFSIASWQPNRMLLGSNTLLVQTENSLHWELLTLQDPSFLALCQRTVPLQGKFTCHQFVFPHSFILRSRINGDVGGRTQMASLVCSAIVLLATFFLLPWLYYLPKCVLSAMYVPHCVRPCF